MFLFLVGKHITQRERPTKKKNKEQLFEKFLVFLRNKRPFFEKFLFFRNKQAFSKSPHVMSEVPLYRVHDTYRRTIGIRLLQGPRGRHFLMSEVPCIPSVAGGSNTTTQPPLWTNLPTSPRAYTKHATKLSPCPTPPPRNGQLGTPRKFAGFGHPAYRGTSLIRKHPTPWTTIGPSA